MESVKTAIGTVLDIHQLRLAPGIAPNDREIAAKLLGLVDSLVNFRERNISLNDLDFDACYQMSRSHMWSWGNEVSFAFRSLWYI